MHRDALLCRILRQPRYARLSGVFEADADAGMHRRETRVTGRRRGCWPRGERDGCNRGRSNELDGRGLHAVPGWDLLRC